VLFEQAYARAIHPRVQANDPWSWRVSTPGLLAHAVRTYGWGFIPNQVLPPLIANVGSVAQRPTAGDTVSDREL